MVSSSGKRETRFSFSFENSVFNTEGKRAIASFKEADRLSGREKEKDTAKIPLAEKGDKPVHPKEAASILEKSLIFNPEDTKKRIDLGRIYAEMGRYDAAILHWEKAVNLEKDIRDLHFWYNLGRTYLRKGKEDKAEDCFRKMLALDPKGKEKLKDEALHGLGQVLLKRGKVEDAIEKFRKAIKKIPLSPLDVFSGELTIHGEIQRIGGVKEKIEAAVADRKKRFFFPSENMNDLTVEERAGFEKKVQLVPIKSFKELFDIMEHG